MSHQNAWSMIPDSGHRNLLLASWWALLAAWVSGFFGVVNAGLSHGKNGRVALTLCSLASLLAVGIGSLAYRRIKSSNAGRRMKWLSGSGTLLGLITLLLSLLFLVKFPWEETS